METLRRYVEGEQTETIKAVPTDYGKTLKDTLNGEGTVIPVDEGVKINDNSLSKNQTWSSDKLNGLFNDKVNKSDVKSEITEDDTNPVNSIAVLGELENYDTSSEVTSKITESISDYNETIESGLMQPGTEQTFTGKKTFSNGVDVGSLSEDGDTINIEVLKDNAGNSGQILKVNDEGVPEWEDVAGAVVDQTFNPTSVNAQSGKAVNEAVTDSVDQTYSASSTKAQSGVAVASGIQSALESLANEKFTKYDSDGVNIDNTLGNYVVEVTENNEGTLPEETTAGIVVQFNSGSTIAQIDYVTTDDGVIAYVRKYENSTWSEWEVSSGGSSKPILLTRAEYDALGGNYEPDTFYVITDENVTGITVDQTYNATSGNPQSGKAVAEGLENALDDYYTKDEIDSQKTYSTEEKVVGKWIDGKPIYQKVLQGSLSTGNILISNVEEIIDYKIIAKTTSWDSLRFNNNIQGSGGNFCSLRLELNEHNITFNKSDSGWVSTTIHTTVLYTKTTD